MHVKKIGGDAVWVEETGYGSPHDNYVLVDKLTTRQKKKSNKNYVLDDNNDNYNEL